MELGILLRSKAMFVLPQGKLAQEGEAAANTTGPHMTLGMLSGRDHPTHRLITAFQEQA